MAKKQDYLGDALSSLDTAIHSLKEARTYIAGAKDEYRSSIKRFEKAEKSILDLSELFGKPHKKERRASAVAPGKYEGQEKTYTGPEVRKMLGINQQVLGRLVGSGKITKLSDDGHIKNYRAKDVDNLLAHKGAEHAYQAVRYKREMAYTGEQARDMLGDINQQKLACLVMGKKVTRLGKEGDITFYRASDIDKLCKQKSATEDEADTFEGERAYTGEKTRELTGLSIAQLAWAVRNKEISKLGRKDGETYYKADDIDKLLVKNS